jgi:hypothetical protein
LNFIKSYKKFGDIGKLGDIGTFGDIGTRSTLAKNRENSAIPANSAILSPLYHVLISSTLCGENQMSVVYIVSSKSYPGNLLLKLIFSNYHFDVQN